jgi:hypothetical protein
MDFKKLIGTILIAVVCIGTSFGLPLANQREYGHEIYSITVYPQVGIAVIAFSRDISGSESNLMYEVYQEGDYPARKCLAWFDATTDAGKTTLAAAMSAQTSGALVDIAVNPQDSPTVYNLVDGGTIDTKIQKLTVRRK